MPWFKKWTIQLLEIQVHPQALSVIATSIAMQKMRYLACCIANNAEKQLLESTQLAATQTM